MLDPRTLQELASYELPRRRGTIEAFVAGQVDSIFLDTSGGSYFYLDNEDRAVIATANRHIFRVKEVETASGPRLDLQNDYDLNPHIPHDCPDRPDLAAQAPDCDKVTTALPDWNGLIWFVSRKGRIGTLEPNTGRVSTSRFDAQAEIQNSFAVASDGVYVVTDFALYRLSADPADGQPHVLWREVYDRGTSIKLGQISHGSGTTPTLMGERYVAISDNADGQVNALVYRRQAKPGEERLVCKVPLFNENQSAVENSFIGYGNSLIIENDSGYKHVLANTRPVGGLLRLDVRPDESGCQVVWQSHAVSHSTVAKLSIGSGLVYAYTVNRHGRTDHRSFTAIDFRSGKTVFSIRTGRGRQSDNNWGSISVGPLPGMALVGTLSGFLKIADPNADNPGQH